MIPWYYAAIAAGVGLILGWAASTFNFLHLRSGYDALAEMLKLLSAKDLQAVANWFQAEANKLRKTGA